MVEFSDFENKFIDKIKDKRLITSLTLIREAMEDIWTKEVRIIKNFTDHGKRHCERLSEYAWKLLEANKGDDLTEREIYLLLAGIYLHDIGMQCDVIRFPEVKEKAVELGANFECTFDAKNSSDYTKKQQKEIRKNHNYLSAAWIDFPCSAEDNITFNTAVTNIPDELIKDLIDVCKFHSGEHIDKCKPFFKYYRNERKLLVAAVLRLADELDVGKDRVNFETTKYFNLPPENALYWWLHSRTIAEINGNIISFIFMLHPYDENYSSKIRNIIIDEFLRKNRPILEVLKTYRILIDVGASSGVEFDIHVKKLPLEIINELERRSQISSFRVDFNYEGDPESVGWFNYTSECKEGKFHTIYDKDIEKRVLEIYSPHETKFGIGYPKDNNNTKKPRGPNFKFNVKTKESFFFYIRVADNKGKEKYLEYTTSHRSSKPVKRENELEGVFRIDQKCIDNHWHTITRNLEDDLYEVFGMKLDSIIWVRIRGNIRLEYFEFY